ncbi:hypothetical protein WJX74_009663 [Apatococcus lobatus]|uniref:Tyrosyl-DNA phosphodiesterase 1 n=1 Tax=Apatococcus lobatus TaxID=904363 RepID=A0AAW1S476_9CHLO
MPEVYLTFPDGTKEPFAARRILGRGSPANLEDLNLSRTQCQLEMLEDFEEEAIMNLTNLGQNSIIIERRLPCDEHTPQSKGWEISDVLDKGMAALLRPACRFYLADRPETTTVDITVLHDDGRPTKRARTEENSTRGVSPFGLLKVQGLPDWANRDSLGLSMDELVSGSIEWALLSNYMIDFGWLLQACPALCTVKDLLILQGDRPSAERLEQQKATATAAGIQKVTFHQPFVGQWGTHHSKAFVLQYSAGLRVIVHTANLIHGDCTHKSQAVWFQDFPHKGAHAPADMAPFGKTLLNYLMALRLPPSHKQIAIDVCNAHDFSSASAYLIPSCPGQHTGPAMHSHGHMAARAVLSKGLLQSRFVAAPVLAQCSSLGSLTPKWVCEEFCASLASGRRIDGALNQALGRPPPEFQLIWPTVEEVQNSNEGWAAGGSIPGSVQNVSKPFLQPFWRRFGGHPAGRQRAMPHMKTYTRYTRDGEMPWLLMGSHNLSKAAWGELQKKGLGDANQFTFWPLNHAAPAGDSSALRACMAIPYCLPPDPYSASDQPWSVNKAHPGIDAYGMKLENASAEPGAGRVMRIPA